MTRRLLAALAAVGMLATAACGDDGDGADEAASSSTTTTSAAADGTTTTAGNGSTTTAPATPATDEGGCPREANTSPANFDPAGGLYAAFLAEVDVAKRSLSFDVVQWLTGEAARTAYLADNPDQSEGPPNDFYIRNSSPQRRTASIAAGAPVTVLRPAGSATAVRTELADLPDHLDAGRQAPPAAELSANPYWLTVDDGAVTAICEQYLP